LIVYIIVCVKYIVWARKLCSQFVYVLWSQCPVYLTKDVFRVRSSCYHNEAETQMGGKVSSWWTDDAE